MTRIDLETCRAMLAHLSPDMPRDEWARVGMALKSEHGDAASDLFDAWSQRGEKYRAADVRSTWRSLKADGGVTIGTLWHMASAAGWRPDPKAERPPATSAAELKAAADARAARAAAERERQAARHRACAAVACELWDKGSDVGESPYLARKRLSGAHGARFAPGGVLRVPMRDAAGELWNVQEIHPAPLLDPSSGEPTGDKRFAAGKGGRKAGLFHVIGNPAGAAVVMLGEGFATCATAHEATSRPAVVAFDAGNLGPVARELRGLHPDALLLVLADDDRDTADRTGRNPGREAATRAARSVRGVALWPEPGDLPAGGSDWNDVAAHAGPERVRERIEAAILVHAAAARRGPAAGPPLLDPSPDAESAPAARDSRPRGTGEGADFDPFTLDERGVWFHGFDVQGRPRSPMWVCAPLEVAARTRMRNGAGWGYLLTFEDPEGTRKEWVIGNAALQGDGVEYRRTLADLGLRIGESRGAREKLAHYVQSRDVRDFARLVERAGWHGRLYVMPGRVFGASEERVILAPEAAAEYPVKQRGSLEKWKASIGRVCEGNSRLGFGVSAAFAGPLLRLAGLQSGGFHFVGASSRGKSTTLHAAASVWGSPELKGSWRSTDNGVEFKAAQCSDLLLIFDELKQCDPRLVGEAVYTLGNGTGRTRAAQRGGLRPTPTWAVLFLSSGEVTLEAHMAAARMRPMEGQRVRMPSIPAEPEGFSGTVFETNHEHDGGHALSKYIEHQAALNYGHAGLAFLARVTAEFDEVREALREGLAAFRAAHVPDHSDGQLGRIADRFALVGVAGELATRWGLTGWPEGWAVKASAACFYAMVKLRPGGFGSGEEAAMLRQARTFFAEHGEDRFADWDRAESDDSHRPNTQQRAGWRKTTKDAAGDANATTWYVLPDAFEKQVCEGFEREAMLRLLREREHLVPDKGRPFDHSARLPGIGKARCYRINSSILDDLSED